MNSSVPVLISTIEKYSTLAQWTTRQIGRFWPEHPRIRFCGIKGGGDCLPLRSDPADWMRVTADACSDLLSEGAEYVYLILDDHPPIARCNAQILGETLPLLAGELGVTSVALGGYGPLNKIKGTIVRWKGFLPERLPVTEKWKLPLHPALWNLRRLHGILEQLLRVLPEENHTPWAFERIGSDLEKSRLPADWLGSCWRVGAVEMSSAEAAGLHGISDRLVRLALRVSSMDALVFKGRAAKDAVEAALSGLRHPRIGPYPCFWSGVMKKGRINNDYLFYAKFQNRPELTDGLEQCFN